MGSDFISIFTWWLVFFLLGIIFLPFAIYFFSNFIDRGYIFAKVLGMLLVSYALFLFGTVKLVPFTHTAIVSLLVAFGFLSLFLVWKFKHEQKEGLRISWKFFLLEEGLFLVALSFWSYVRAHEPSIHGLEKYMDFGFVNAILHTEFFPAKDLWLTPFSINYYYFGHLVTAVLTKLSGLDPAVTYNLMIATLFAFTFTCAFSIGANLIAMINPKSETRNPKQYQNPNDRNSKRFEYSNLFRYSIFDIRTLIGGLMAGFLVALAGNLHTIYAFFDSYIGENPVPFWQLALDFNLSNYWYPNATRFIPFTIHEFPIYSFVVSDLHGHVLSIPIVLMITAVLLNILISQSLNIFKLILLSFLIAAAYMTNAWDGIIYFLLASLVLLYLHVKPVSYAPNVGKTQIPALPSDKSNLKAQAQNYSVKLKIFNFEFQFYALRFTLYAFAIGIGFLLFSMPFSVHFKPFVSGIGVLCAPEFLTNIGKVGPFLFETEHCQRSPLWQIIILQGFWYFWAISFVIFLRKLNARRLAQNGASYAYRLNAADIFVLILIGISTLLLIIPEFIYAKDIYPGHYRANTMFKLGYEAFMMMGISSAYIIMRLVTGNMGHITRKILRLTYVLVAVFFIFLVSIYPYFAISAYYGNLKIYKGLDGLIYLKELYPQDYEAILWLRDTIDGQPVILEAAGESYTDYARVSANTGLPTVVGWPVHEWLWRGSYDEPGKRVAEVEQAYTTATVEETKAFLQQYKVEYVFVGALERQKYPTLNEEKFKTLGESIYQNGQTTVYKIR